MLRFNPTRLSVAVSGFLALGLSAVAQTPVPETNFESNILVFEHFTNASCAPCALANPTFKGLLGNNQGKATAVRHHVSWPGLDSMYLANPSEPTHRVNFYGITGVPALQLGSFSLNSTMNASTLQTWYNVTPANWVYQIQTQITGDADPLVPDSVTVTGQVGSVANIDSTNKLLLFLVEDSLYFPPPGQPGGGLPGNNGEKLFPMVLRKMIPDTNGISVGNGQTPTPLGFRARLGSRWRQRHLFLLGFVQNTVTKRVHRGFKLKLGYSIHTATPSDLLDTEQGFSIYPNPSSGAVVLQQLGQGQTASPESDWSVQFLDAQGKIFALPEDHKVSLDAQTCMLHTEFLPAGLYQIQVMSPLGGRLWSQKFLKTPH